MIVFYSGWDGIPVVEEEFSTTWYQEYTCNQREIPETQGQQSACRWCFPPQVSSMFEYLLHKDLWFNCPVLSRFFAIDKCLDRVPNLF